MADGHARMTAQIERLRRLPTLTRRMAPKVARVLKREIESNIRRGVGPDGTPWPKTQDGRQPLRGAGSALRVSFSGTVVVASLEGHHARHHIGAVKGGVKRPILPTAKLPDPVTKAVDEVATEEFRAVMGGS